MTNQTNSSGLITVEFLTSIQAEYRMDWDGVHGFAHWQRVQENGLRLADLTGANQKVVTYFAYLHDNQRQNDGNDPGHGRRASQLIRAKFAGQLNLTAAELDLLCEACAGHTDGLTEGDITIQTCWDADRLDLFRVGIFPDPQYLCTSAAKDAGLIAWAAARSVGR